MKKIIRMGTGKVDKKLPKDFGSPLRIVATTLAIFLFSQLLAAVIVELFIAVTHSGSSSSTLVESPLGQFFYILLAELGAVWIVIKVVKKRGLSLARIGLGRRPQFNDVTKALIGFGIFFILLIAVGVVLSWIFPELNDQKQDVGFNELKDSTDRTLAFIALVILPPIGEEVLVRGYLYSGLRKHWKILPAMLATSLLFGAAHLQTGSGVDLLWAAAANTFILSIVLVYLREKTGALYAGMLVHALNNFIAFGVHFNT